MQKISKAASEVIKGWIFENIEDTDEEGIYRFIDSMTAEPGIVPKLTVREIKVLIQYIDFMEQFDDDPLFRDSAVSARKKMTELEGEV